MPSDQHAQQESVEVWPDDIDLFLEQAVRDKARERELRRAGHDQRSHDEVAYGHLELRHGGLRDHHCRAEYAYDQYADNGQYPGPRTDDARVGVRLRQPAIAGRCA